MNSADAKPAPPANTTSLGKGELISLIGLGLGIASLCAVLALVPSRRGPSSLVRPTLLNPPRHLTSFSLVDRTGRPVHESEFAEKFLVVNFAFTSCSLSCRAVNDRMAEVQRLVATDPDVQLVSLSVDPRSDTPSALAKFALEFGADTNRWLFLTGEKDQMYRLLETSFISRSPELTGLVPGGFAHTDSIMLVDPTGRVWASFNGLKTNVARAIVKEIAHRRQSLASR